MKNVYITLSVIILLISSCLKEKIEPYQEQVTLTSQKSGIEGAIISPEFTWKTTQDISIRLTSKDNQGQNIQNIFHIVDQNQNLLSKGMVNKYGVYETVLSLPITAKEITIYSNYVGLLDKVTLPIGNGNINFDFHTNIDKMDLSNVIINNDQNSNFSQNRIAVSACGYLSPFDVNGVPTTLETDDVISSDFLNQVNASLPERRPVPVYHPQYIEQGINTDLRINELADVYLTFIHEGAGYRNTLGFYTYSLDNPPATVDDIQNCKIIFPNLSFTGSGGNLHSGQKVFLGQFPENTGIGWFLIANGWTGSTVNMSKDTYYSNPDFNPENTEDNRKHMVLIKDDERELLLLGFEDLHRQNQGSDNDFNDAIFYITANPYSAIVTDDLPEIDVEEDLDNDGVSDLYDDYPEDPSKSFDNFYPSKDQFSTLAFEDLWPSKGDYDYNDLVLDYQYNRITNNQNNVVQLVGDFRIKGVLAGFKHNAFAVELPIQSYKIQSINGSRTENNFFLLNSNGTESGHLNAVIPIFDHAGQNFRSSNDPDPIVIDINFASSVSLSELSTAPYNPFLIVNRQRGREVHLPGYLPTILSDADFFKTYHDNTDVSTFNQTYKTIDQLPWGIHLPVSFNYPKEGEPINTGYMHFLDWAESEGTFYPDWYENKTGYQNSTKLTY